MNFFVEIITNLANHPSIILSISICILLIYTFYLDHKIIVLTRGANGASLEDTIKKCIEGVSQIEKKNELISKHALSLEERTKEAVRNAQVIRYKAFDVNGSNQSFSLALLNEKGNGVIISSLHSHDRVSTFAKGVENYESTYELTDEEKYVINESKKSHKHS